MFPESGGFVAMLRLQALSKTYVIIYPYLITYIVKVDEIVRPCDRHSNITETLRKHATKYKNMRKWMVDFFRKVENRCIKIARVNSILITKFIKLH